MEYFDFKNEINYEQLNIASNLTKNGGLVIFPTETVYGIGTNGLNENAILKIFEAKGRKSDNPLILHISDLEMLDNIAKNISDVEYKLINAFWPGPFTIILDKTDLVPYSATGNLDTVAVRMPSNKIAANLIKMAGVPIAAPSANISGKPSGTNISDIIDELGNKVDCIIDSGISDIGLESTVVRVIDGVPHILRPGKITSDDILKVCDKIIVDKHILNNCDLNEPVLSPGTKYKHYSPSTKCVLIYSENNDKMVSKINELYSYNSNSLIICSNENSEKYNCENKILYGSKYNLNEISHNIFQVLRKVDSFDVDIVFIEGVSKEGIGLAIMNRLLRACGFDYIEL